MLNESMTLDSWWHHGCVALSSGDELEIRPEPENEYDENAIALYKGGRKVAYIPWEQTHLLHKAMEDGELVTVTVQMEGSEDLDVSPMITVQDSEGRRIAEEAQKEIDASLKRTAMGCLAAFCIAFCVIFALILAAIH